MNSLQLRKAIRDKFAWPGGYEIFGITSDGAALCCDCMRKEYLQIAYARRHTDTESQWHVVAVDYTANTDEIVTCDHCNKSMCQHEIESPMVQS